jgi:hypothetical protein
MQKKPRKMPIDRLTPPVLQLGKFKAVLKMPYIARFKSMRSLGVLVWAFFTIMTVGAAAAEEYLYDNGVFVGLGTQASIVSRDKKISYGFPSFCGPTPFCGNLATPFGGTQIHDVAPSPTLTVGYKLNDDNAISLKGDWARYSVSRNLTASDATGFITIAVDGANGTFVPPGSGPTSVDIDWESDVFNVALEYQRRLLGRDLGGLFGLLGFKFRHEGQSFDARAVNPTVVPSPVVDSYHETLKEFLFGPYGGVKLAFRPDKQSPISFNIRGDVGYYFKNAFFDSNDRFFNGNHFSQDDHSKKGTLFAGAGAAVTYAFSRNCYLDVSYEFSWIKSVAHIWNTNRTPADASAATPSKIIGSRLITHTPGVKFVYKFD